VRRSGPTASRNERDPIPASGVTTSARRALVVALIGNPNTGKTSLFNALTGFRRHVANYPGVTVETARGPVRGTARPMELLDLPGTYSLAAMSPDEMLVSNVVCGRLEGHRRPDAILAIVDAANLPRNLYLVSQLLDLGLPTVVAVNMIDVARGRGINVDCELLSRRLGVPAVAVVATRQGSAAPIVQALDNAVSGNVSAARAELPKALNDEVAALCNRPDAPLQRAEALRILLDRGGCAERQYLAGGGSSEELQRARTRLEAAGIDGPRVEVQARYRWANTILDGVISRPEKPVVTWSDRIDRVLTHKVGGAVFLLAVLFLVFQSIFTWAGPLMETIDWVFGSLAEAVAGSLPEGALRSLLTDGIIVGIGGVLTFLPQILILFAFFAALEDCGYMARAAYMNDRLMRSLGLSGRAFIPLLSSFACAVPAIMGTRTIADRRERFVTILIAPFMSCSARLPVYVLMTAAFVPARTYLGGWVELQALVMLGMYLVGIVVAIPVAWLLRRTAFAGPSSGFMLELPSYKWPRLPAIWQRMYFAGRKFLVSAGTVILVVNLVVWALGYFPRSSGTRAAVEQRAQTENWDEAKFESELAGAYLRESYLGRLGHAIEPVVRPIGWDWRIGTAVVASFPAREVVVATLATIYNLGEGADEESISLRRAIKRASWPDTGKPVFTLPVALSIMVFFALCAQCFATLVLIGREMGSWAWPVVSFIGMTTIAYLAAWGVSVAAQALGL
jgi:ferrous iron transport protein B